MYKKIADLTEGVYPFHMPGHKRNPEFLRDCPDITEITGADDLHHSDGMLGALKSALSYFFDSTYTLISTAGSTPLIHTAITAAVKSKGNIYIARNCHKSVYNAVYLNSLNAGYIMPEIVDELGCYGAVSPSAVEAALNKVPTEAVVITSPTYEGIVSDIKGIAEVCHRFGALLIVDAAHGAHLGLSEHFLSSARSEGADIVIESAHKTLPCLTGAAMLHICSRNIRREAVERAFSVYHTSSPSYPILASIQFAQRTLRRQGKELFRLQSDRLDDLYRSCHVLNALSLYTAENHDKSKIIINCSKSSTTGYALKKILLQDYKIECEMATKDYVLALSSVADTALGFDRLSYALTQIDQDLERFDFENESPTYPTPILKMPIRRALEAECEVIRPSDAIGRISAGYAYSYPPGIPIIAPGEVITAEILKTIRDAERWGAVIHFDSKDSYSLRVVKE
ncbi:MAG: aminotransferase class V-fold PLP-dependent enzyme [Clostridia bacterium]|nr:aminotransferase class V-fold PLP-dependent enzyme [Clostridia bacterium]